MKLRIRGNSLRLRLTKSEVAEIDRGTTVEETVEFGGEPEQRLVYALVSTDDFENPTAEFDSGRITVYIPKLQAQNWAQTNKVKIETEKPIGNGRALRILIEKDFACLESRAGVEDTDTFEHPRQNEAGNQILLNAFD